MISKLKIYGRAVSLTRQKKDFALQFKNGFIALEYVGGKPPKEWSVLFCYKIEKYYSVRKYIGERNLKEWLLFQIMTEHDNVKLITEHQIFHVDIIDTIKKGAKYVRRKN